MNSRLFWFRSMFLCVLVCVPVLGDVPGDGDGDADVDAGDFALMASCLLGPDASPNLFCEEPFDFEFDADVDMRDFAAFQRCLSGENLPKNADCAGHLARIEEGCLHVVGTVADSTLALRLKQGDAQMLEVDVGNDGIAEFTVHRNQFDCILIDARSGDDLVIIDESRGIFTDMEITTINGGRGNDTLQGGSGGETFIGGDGDDAIFMGPGDDRFVWNPGDDSDFIEGDAGTDTIEVNGGNGAETFTITANGTRVRFDRLTPAPFDLDLGTCELIALQARGGNDTASCTGNLAALIKVLFDGGAGDDALLGSNGIDMLIGGDGNDFIDGQQGNDAIFAGDGDDTIGWDPGDGSDTVEGQDGWDALVFNGSAANEIYEFSANGDRLRFTRNVANIVMDVNDVEQIDLQALGGADQITVHSLTGTDVAQVNVDLAVNIIGSAGDGQIDNVIVNGTTGSDVISVAGGIAGTVVTGLAATVNISAAESSNDRLTVNGLGDADHLQATGLGAGIIGLTLSGGAGDDVLIGSAGADTIHGDGENDRITGGAGSDTIFMGSGNDRAIWNPGHDSDFVEGESGSDIVEVNGGDGDESFTVTANGTRVRFDRLNPAPFNLDIGSCENLIVNANGGNDSLACTGNLAALIQITADGGPGNDTLLGSNGIDVLTGGADNDFIDGQQANDVLLGGIGNDTFQWDPGDGNDTIEGQDGLDILQFHGSAANEIYEFSANGHRLRLTRNIANIVMDVSDVEQVDLQVLGGADDVLINSLAGTDVAEINVELASLIGGTAGDGQIDDIVVNGTGDPDTIHAVANAGAVEVSGLSTFVRIRHSEAVNDTITINGLGGTDAITSGPGLSNLITLIMNQ